MSKQSNGNNALNNSREDQNDRTAKLKNMSRTLRAQLNNKRRYRSI